MYDFGACGAEWANSSCHPRVQDHLPFVAFYGDKGSVTQDGAGYKVYDLKGAEVSSGTGPSGDKIHFENWVSGIRNGTRLNSEIGEGQKSTLLCHLGNIAYRTGHALQVDPKSGKILGDDAALKLWGREYRPGWEPVV